VLQAFESLACTIGTSDLLVSSPKQRTFKDKHVAADEIRCEATTKTQVLQNVSCQRMSAHQPKVSDWHTEFEMQWECKLKCPLIRHII